MHPHQSRRVHTLDADTTYSLVDSKAIMELGLGQAALEGWLVRTAITSGTYPFRSMSGPNLSSDSAIQRHRQFLREAGA